MKKESALVGAICLLLGGLIGYIAGQLAPWKQMREHPHEQHDHEREGRLPQGMPSTGLPEGHPPIPSQADLENLKKVVDGAPDNSKLLTDLANKLYDAAKYEEAIPYYKQALALEPNNVDISTDLGTALFYAGRPDEAIAQYKNSLRVKPRHVQSLHNLVLVHLQGKKDAAAAGEALNRLKDVDPGNPSIRNLEKMISQASSRGANPRQRIF